MKTQTNQEIQLRITKTVNEVVDKMVIIASTDKNGHINFINDHFCKISGYSREELLGKDHRIINSGQMPKIFFKNMWEKIKAGHIWTGSICNRSKNGVLYWVDTIIVPQFDSTGNIDGYVSIRRDITERVKLENAAIQNEKLASLGMLAGGIIHEINNPLAAVMMHAENLKDKLIKKDDFALVEKNINGIIKSAERINKIAQGIKTFSRDAATDSMEEASVSVLLDELQSVVSSNTKKYSIEMEIQKVSELVKVHCRSSQILQILINLVGNAADAVQGLTEKWIRIEFIEKNEFIEFAVVNSGPLIPKNIQERIFDDFFTTKEVGRGTGLGLSLSLKIAESHDGTLAIDQNSPHTRFVLKIPKKAQSE